MEKVEAKLKKVDYPCERCNMVVNFFIGYTMEHKGHGHHSFDLYSFRPERIEQFAMERMSEREMGIS